MLSGETSVGKHPVGAVRTMERIIDAVESERRLGARRWCARRGRAPGRSCGRPRTSARRSRSRRWPRSPRPARRPAGWPPCTPVSRCWPSPSTPGCAASWRCRWGVETFLVPSVQHTDDMVGPGRLLAAVDRPAQGRRPGRRRRRQPAQHRGLDQPHPGARSGHRLVSEPARRQPGRGPPGRARRSRSASPTSSSARRPSTERQRIFGGQVAGQALMAAGRPCRRSGRCTRCTPTSCGRATRPRRSATPSSGCATAGRSPPAGSSPGRTARARRSRSSRSPPTSTRGRSRSPSTRCRCPTSPARRRCSARPRSRRGTASRRRWMDAMGPRRRAAFPGGPVRRAAQAAAGHQALHAGCGSPGGCPTTPAVHAAALTFVSDLTLLSAGFARLGGGWRTSSARASTTRCGSTSRCAPTSGSSTRPTARRPPAGTALCFGQIWAADGTHVATVAQEGLIRSLED